MRLSSLPSPYNYGLAHLSVIHWSITFCVVLNICVLLGGFGFDIVKIVDSVSYFNFSDHIHKHTHRTTDKKWCYLAIRNNNKMFFPFPWFHRYSFCFFFLNTNLWVISESFGLYTLNLFPTVKQSVNQIERFTWMIEPPALNSQCMSMYKQFGMDWSMCMRKSVWAHAHRAFALSFPTKYTLNKTLHSL